MMDVLIKLAGQYGHRFYTILPDSKVGADYRAGFIDAPDINAKKNMSRPTMAPITIPLKPLRPFVKTLTNITAIS